MRYDEMIYHEMIYHEMKYDEMRQEKDNNAFACISLSVPAGVLLSSTE